MYALRPNLHRPSGIHALLAISWLGLAALYAQAPAAVSDSAGTTAPTAVGAPTSGTASGNPHADQLLESILAKEGVSLSGAFRSEFLNSSIGGAGAIAEKKSEESSEFTSVDFDIRARPNTATQGRLIMRMHQDWRNFFSDIGNPINTRWLSIDGKVKDMFSYNAGDFRQHYSPLTLSAPELSVMYEPAIFATGRQEAMDEVFLGQNDRILEGVNFNFDASVDQNGKGLLKDAHVNALGARLRNVETNYQNGDKVTDFVEKSLVEKYLAASNLDLASPTGLSLGGSYLYIFDKQGSYAGPGRSDTAGQKTRIAAGRAGFELGDLLKAEDWGLGVSGEYAASMDDTSFIAKAGGTDVTSRSIDGSALRAGLHGHWTGGKFFGLRGSASYIRNEADYRNELAQSPVFVGERIMNIENDTNSLLTDDVRARNYSTFDAMYQHVFKFAPSDNTNLWMRAPFSKNSYRNSIMNQDEMAAFAASRVDTSLQLVMPFGPATPNRAGIQSDVTLGLLDRRIELQGLYANLENLTGVKADSAQAWPATKFTQMGGGLKAEIGAFIGLALPLTASGSLVRSTADNAGIVGDTAHSAIKVVSDFLNAGAQFSFWKRFSLLGGYQRIETTVTRAAQDRLTTQTHMAGGLDYKVAAGSHLLASIGEIKVVYPSDAAGQDFSQLQSDLFLTVHF